MAMTVDPETKNDIDFIRQIYEAKLIPWPPIDFLPVELGDFDASTWFEKYPDVYRQHRFVEFGRDGSGSGYCLWYYPGLTQAPPVVFWGSEGDYYFVAGSVKDFIRQLASGIFSSGFWEEDKEGRVDWPALRKACESHLGPWQEDAGAIRARGASDHPDFEEWVSKHWE